jgi:hypothetical protein
MKHNPKCLKTSSIEFDAAWIKTAADVVLVFL